MNKTPGSLFLCLLFSALASAQSGEEKAVGDRVEALRKAMIAADTSALNEIAAPQLSYGHSNGLVEDRAAFVNEYVTRKSVFTTLNFSEQTIAVSGDVAIVRHHFVGDTNNNGVPGRADLVNLMIWQKQQGTWKLLARQAAKLPVAK